MCQDPQSIVFEMGEGFNQHTGRTKFTLAQKVWLDLACNFFLR